MNLSKTDKTFILTSLLLGFLVTLFISKAVLSVGDYVLYFMRRIDNLALAINNHDYYPAILYNMNLGDGSQLMESNIFLYPLALITSLGTNRLLIVKISVFFLSSVSLFAIHKISALYDKKILGYVLQIMLSLFICYASKSLLSNTVNLLSAIVLVLLTIYTLMSEARLKISFLVVELALLLLLNTYIFMVMFIICLFSFAVKKGGLVTVLITAVFVLLLDCFYLLPKAEQLSSIEHEAYVHETFDKAEFDYYYSHYDKYTAYLEDWQERQIDINDYNRILITDLRLSEGYHTVEVPRIYYKGYHAYLYEEGKYVTECEVGEDAYHFIVAEIPLQNYEADAMEIVYVTTTIQKAGRLITVLSLVGYVFFSCISYRRK